MRRNLILYILILFNFFVVNLIADNGTKLLANSKKYTQTTFSFVEDSTPYSVSLKLSEKGIYLDLTQNGNYKFILLNNKVITDKLQSKQERYKLLLLLEDENSILRKEVDRKIKAYIACLNQEQKSIEKIKDIKQRNKQSIAFIKRKNSWTTGYARWKSYLTILKAKKSLYKSFLKSKNGFSKDSNRTSKNYNVTIDNFPFNFSLNPFGQTTKTDDVSFFQLINNLFSGFVWMLMFPFLMILFVIIIVAILLVFNYRQNRMKYRLAMQALERGQILPERVFVDDESSFSISPQQALKNKGIKQMALGVGVALLLYFIFNIELASIGFLIFCLGLGKYIIAEQSIKKKNMVYSENEQEKDVKKEFSVKEDQSPVSSKDEETSK